MLSSLTLNMNVPRSYAIILVTQGDLTLDMARAWVDLQQTWTAPSYLVIVAADANHAIWCREFLCGEVKGQVLAGDVRLPGFAVPPELPPPELLEKTPDLPQLKVAVWKRDGDTLQMQIPAHVIDAWSGHVEFSERFELVKWDIGQTATSPALTNNPGRTATGEAVVKRAKTEGAKTEAEHDAAVSFDIKSISDAKLEILKEVKLPNHMTLLFCPGNKILIANPTVEERSLERDSYLCGFLKGAWTKTVDSEDATITYSLEDATSEIVMPGPMKITTVGAQLEARRDKNPDVKIMYHTIVDTPVPDHVSFFKLSLDSPVHWTVQLAQQKEEHKVLPNHAAGLVPHRTWVNWFTKIVFLTKWQPRGLMPVRPYIFMKESVTLPAGTYVELK